MNLQYNILLKIQHHYSLSHFLGINVSSSLLCENTCFCNRFNLNSRLCSNVQDLFVTFVLILWMTNLNSQLKKRKKSSTVFFNVASIWFYAKLVPTTPLDHQQLIKWWDVAHCMRKWAHRISSLGALLAGMGGLEDKIDTKV
jgi:hypothetical protein